MGKINLFAITILSLIAVNWAAVKIDSNLQNKIVDCSIDLTTQLVRTQCKVTLENVAKKDLNGATYTFLFTAEQHERLAYISVRDATKKELKGAEENVSEGVAYTVTLNSGSPVLTIETVFTKSLEPYPTQITQAERQLVRYSGNAYLYSPYKTIAQKTTFTLASKAVESYTTVKPSSQSDATITYGTYENIARKSFSHLKNARNKHFASHDSHQLTAYTSEPIVIHFENQTPFLTVANLERVIEVSHWGNIAVEETIDIVHTGAELKGSFSRYDFQKDPRGSQAAVKSYKTVLPASATGVYYRFVTEPLT